MNSLPMQGAPLIDTKAQQLEGSEGGERVKEKQQISLFPLEYTLASGCKCVSICVCVFVIGASAPFMPRGHGTRPMPLPFMN